MSRVDPNFVEWLKDINNVIPYLPSSITLLGLLDVGGQGIVYKGLVDSKEAAIKIYFPGQVDKRIEREIKALGYLDCYSIVKLYWSGQIIISNESLYVVATSMVPGETLSSLIKKGSLDLNQIGVITYDIAKAIKCMWDIRVVHRDLKPSNIIVKPDGRACVIDLGLARHLDDSSLTQLGATWGTPGYLSPEQSEFVRQLTCKSDIFALGIVAVESFMGRHPTFRDQKLVKDLSSSLPQGLQSWKYANLLQDILHIRPTKRPMPENILDVLSEYSPS